MGLLQYQDLNHTTLIISHTKLCDNYQSHSHTQFALYFHRSVHA